MKQSLQLKVSQQLTLTPQLQQSIRLLQLSTLDLQQEIENILHDNPMLERLCHAVPRLVLHAEAATSAAHARRAGRLLRAWFLDEETKMHPHLRPLFLLTNKLVPDAIRQPLRKAFGKSSTNPKWIDSTHLKFQDHNPFCHTKADTLLAQSRQQLFHSNLPMLLHYEDRDSMAHSIESRTPFLDYRVVEFSLSLPAHYKIASGWTKRVMREGMQDTLPDAIRLRTDKMAFVTPEEEWMRQHAPEKFREALKESIAHSKGILNAHAATYLEEMIAGKRAFNFLPWRMICFGKWMKDFEVKI